MTLPQLGTVLAYLETVKKLMPLKSAPYVYKFISSWTMIFAAAQKLTCIINRLVFVQALSLAALALSPALYAAPVALSGQFTGYFWAYESNINSVNIDIGGGVIIPTGPIKATLDLSNPAAQVSVFNFDTMTQTNHVDLIVNALGLGVLDQKIHIDETGLSI